jgi:hypothetical protein
MESAVRLERVDGGDISIASRIGIETGSPHRCFYSASSSSFNPDSRMSFKGCILQASEYSSFDLEEEQNAKPYPNNYWR